MGQTQRGKPEAPAVETGPRAGLSHGDVESIGRYLARERRLRGISLQELSATTRIPLRSLERLESGAFDDDPDGFVRGFVRTVARALGLPPEETLSRMLPEVDASAAEGGVGARLGRPVAVVAGLLVTIALGLALWGAWHSPAALDPAPADEGRVFRRDAVRELARDHAALAAEPALTPAAPAVAEPALTPAAPAVAEPALTPAAPAVAEPALTPAAPAVAEPALTPAAPAVAEPRP